MAGNHSAPLVQGPSIAPHRRAAEKLNFAPGALASWDSSKGHYLVPRTMLGPALPMSLHSLTPPPPPCLCVIPRFLQISFACRIAI